MEIQQRYSNYEQEAKKRKQDKQTEKEITFWATQHIFLAEREPDVL